MARMVETLERRFYPGYEANWDDSILREHVLQVLKPTDKLLDLGAGAGIIKQMNFRGLAQEVSGVDPDPRVTTNPNLDIARQGVGETIPFADGYFDVALADNVLEHLENPAAVFAEVSRVLKPGGYFLFKTPNFTHYMPIIAHLTPTSFHRFYARLRNFKPEDTFPTRYRANSKAAIAHWAKKTGFSVDYVRRIEGRPEYLKIALPLYLLSVAYERIVNSVELLQPFRILLVGRLRKN